MPETNTLMSMEKKQSDSFKTKTVYCSIKGRVSYIYLFDKVSNTAFNYFASYWLFWDILHLMEQLKTDMNIEGRHAGNGQSLTLSEFDDTPFFSLVFVLVPIVWYLALPISTHCRNCSEQCAESRLTDTTTQSKDLF